MPTAALPVGPPKIDVNNIISVSAFLANPTRITQRVYELTYGDVLLTRFFSSGGAVTGGAMIVMQTDPTTGMFPVRDVEMIQPASEFPVITGAEVVPIVAPVEKWGGKLWITDEARDRNDAILFTNELSRLANAIVRTVNQRAMEIVAGIFTQWPGQVQDVSAGPGLNWDLIVPTAGLAPTQPYSDVQRAIFTITSKMGSLTPDTVLLNPQEAVTLGSLYGPTWRDLFQDPNGAPLTVTLSPDVTAGTGYVLPAGRVGEVRYERGLFTETWREPETERNWSQTSIKPAMAAVEPGAIVKMTGLHS